MTQVRRQIGFAIEGLGDDPDATDGWCFYAGGEAPSVGNYEWVPALVELPRSLSTRIDPFSGTWSASALRLELDASDRIAARLLAEQRLTPHVLPSAVAPDVTTIDATGIEALQRSVVWLGDECVELGALSGGNFISCVRGIWGTRTHGHEAGALVFTANPYLERRIVRLILHDLDTGAEVVRWRGLVLDVGTSDDGARIIVETEELFGWLRSARLNLNARTWRDGPITVARRPATGDYLEGSLRDLGARVRPDWPTQAYQLGDELIVTAQAAGGAVYLPGARLRLGTRPAPDADALDGEVWQLLVVDRLSGYAATEDLDHPYHPLAIALALLTSTGRGDAGTWDVLSEQWGMGLTGELVDLATWSAEIDASPGAAIDQLVLGWDGEVVAPLEVIARTLLQPFGWFLAVSTEGLLTVKRLRAVEISDTLNAAQVLRYPDGPLRLERALRDRIERVVAEVGGHPARAPITVPVRVTGRGSRRERLEDARTWSLDYSTVRPGALLLGDSNAEGLLAFALVQLVAQGLDRAPRLHLRFADGSALGGATVELGDVVRVSDLAVSRAWFVDGDGARVEIDGASVASYGLVVELGWDLVTHTYTGALLMIGSRAPNFARERAPAARVASWNGAGVYTITNTFGFAGGDALAFEAGDEVRLCDRRGVPTSASVGEVTARSATTITVSGLGAPSAGDMLRLAESADYANATRYPATDRPYACLGDALGEFEDASAEVVADVYGSRVWPGQAGDEITSPEFVALDDDAVALDGTSAEPLDVFVEQTLREGLAWLIEDGSRVSWAPRTHNAGAWSTDAGVRPYASWGLATILYLPWLILPDLEQVELALIARVATESGELDDQTNASVDVRLELVGDATSWRTTQSLGSTMGDTPEFAPHVITLDLEAGTEPTTQGIGALAVWARGGRGLVSQASTTSAQVLAGNVVAPAAVELFGDTASARPNADGLDTAMLLAGVGFDHLHRDGAPTPDQAEVFPLARNPEQFDRYYLDYIQLHAAEISTAYRDTTILAQSDHGAQRPVLAEVCASHALRCELAQRRPRCVAIGPGGEVEGGGFPASYVTRWPRVAADEGEVDALVLPCWLDTSAPQLLVLLHVLPSWCIDLPGSGAEDLSDVEKYAAACTWTITATVEQLEDGDTWSTASDLGSASVTPELPHFLTARTGRTPALSSEWWCYDGEYPLREGRLYAEDLRWVQRLAIAVPTTHDPTAGVPVRVRLTCEADDASLIFPAELVPSNDTNDWADPERVRLAIVGVSVWEVPA